MKINELLKDLSGEAVVTQDELQIIEYELSNKFNVDESFHVLGTVHSKSLKYKLQLLEEEIQKENLRLGNPEIKNMNVFIKGIVSKSENNSPY